MKCHLCGRDVDVLYGDRAFNHRGCFNPATAPDGALFPLVCAECGRKKRTFSRLLCAIAAVMIPLLLMRTFAVAGGVWSYLLIAASVPMYFVFSALFRRRNDI